MNGELDGILINGVKYIPAPPEPTGKGLLDALEVRFDSDAGDWLTVRQYNMLKCVLEAVHSGDCCFVVDHENDYAHNKRRKAKP